MIMDHFRLFIDLIDLDFKSVYFNVKNCFQEIVIYRILNKTQQSPHNCQFGTTFHWRQKLYVWVTLCTLEKDNFFPLPLPSFTPR